MRRLTSAALFSCTLLVSTLAANTSDLPDRSQTGSAISNQPNRNQPLRASKASLGTSTRSSLDGIAVGLFSLRIELGQDAL